MSNETIRFYCDYCKKTLAIKINEELQNKIKTTADKWPYPLIYPHEGHWAVIYLDEEFKERGVTVSKIAFEE